MSLKELIDAVYFASYKHKDQRRKDKVNTPYINHPIHVASLLTEAGVTDPVTIISALLHDTVEDTKTSFEEIEARFGLEVASVVREVTDDKSLPKVERKQLQIEHAKIASVKAKLVKIADKYSNLHDILENPPSFWSKEERDGYIIWCYAVCQHLKGVNAIMDQKIEELFYQLGIIKLMEEELNEKLTTYYKVIEN